MDTGELKYGFRHDPMAFVANDASIHGADVRAQIFGRFTPEDDRARKEVGESEIRRILARQNADGTFGDSAAATGGAFEQLLDAGLAPQDRQLQQIVETYLRESRAAGNDGELEGQELSVYGLRGLCLLDRRDVPEVERSLRAIVAHKDEWSNPRWGCSSSPPLFWRCLRAGQHIIPDIDVQAIVDEGFRRITAETDLMGACTWKSAKQLTEAAAPVNTPDARAYVMTQISPILRGQNPDGGWGDSSLAVFRALVTYGLLDLLADRPPLPADWRVVRTLLTPTGDVTSLTHDGERFWALDWGTREAVAISGVDAAVVRRIDIPLDEPACLGFWDGGLCVSQCDPNPSRFVKLDPMAGNVLFELPMEGFEPLGLNPLGSAQVGDELWVCDEYAPGVYRFKTDNLEQKTFVCPPGGGGCALAPTKDGVWHLGGELVKNSFDGQIMDWGEKPFGDDTTGIAWDGRNLWALDSRNGRICMIEKTESGRNLMTERLSPNKSVAEPP